MSDEKNIADPNGKIEGINRDIVNPNRNIESINRNVVNPGGKDVITEGAKKVANAYAGPLGGKAVDLVSKTKLGKNVLNAASNGLSKALPMGNKGNLGMINSTSENKNEDKKNSDSGDVETKPVEYQNNEQKKEDSKSSSSGIFNGSKKDKDKLFGKKSLKTKLIIIGIAVQAFIFFIFILAIPLSMLNSDSSDTEDDEYDDGTYEGDYNSDGSYVSNDNPSVANNSGYWWPIGSKETTTINGKLFATGAPSSTVITAYYDGNDSTHNGYHGAIDISANINGENVIATRDGRVIRPNLYDSVSIGTCTNYPNGANCSGYGNYIIIDHGGLMYSLYAHMYQDTIKLRTGDYVKQGQVIGKSGSSGNSTGGHLHFEIRLGANSSSNRVNPLEYVSPSNPRPRTSSTTSSSSTNNDVEDKEV